MALNPSGAISLAGPSTGQSIAIELGVSATATISLNDTNVRTLAGVASGVIVMPTDFWGKSNFTPTQKAIFGYGSPFPNALVSITNLVSSTGVVASDTPGVGTARDRLAAAGYGGDKAIFGYGNKPAPSGINYNITNLVSNTGVVAANTPGVGTGRQGLAAAGYGGDKAIFGYGIYSAPGSPAPTTSLSMTNLVSNTGVVASDTPGVGTGRRELAAASYGGDKAIFGFGLYSIPAITRVSITNLVSNTGVVASDTPGVGTVRSALAAAGYGGDKAIFGFGGTPTTSITNLVSNTGVVASDTPGVGTARTSLAAAGYGGDKAIFGYGQIPSGSPGILRTTNLVSNTGVVASDNPGVGSVRQNLAAAGYSSTA
jgi:hypothetical protein